MHGLARLFHSHVFQKKKQNSQGIGLNYISLRKMRQFCRLWRKCLLVIRGVRAGILQAIKHYLEMNAEIKLQATDV